MLITNIKINQPNLTIYVKVVQKCIDKCKLIFFKHPKKKTNRRHIVQHENEIFIHWEFKHSKWYNQTNA